MRRVPWRAWLPGLALLAVHLPGLAAPAADAGLARVQAFLADTKTLRADFRQQVVDGRGQILEDSSGAVVMARPGRFRWDYRAPFERVIVSDGQRIWLYEADLSQVTVRRLTAGIGDTPAALLTGEQDVLDRFDVQRSWRDGDLLYVALAPRAADGDFAAVTLGFRGERLVWLELDDRLGQRTRITFSDVALNAPVESRAFTFQAPPGVDVIDDTDL